jgi:DNA-directed RNA polymerase specialized sigma24 family protein
VALAGLTFQVYFDYVSGQVMPDTPPQERLAAWFSQWRQPLRRWLGSRRRIPAADLDDLAQDVFLRLIHYERAEIVDAPQAYLFRVAANVANEWAMRARNQQSLSVHALADQILARTIVLTPRRCLTSSMARGYSMSSS